MMINLSMIIAILLFIIFISFNNGYCLLSERESEAYTEKYITLKNNENSYERSSDEDTYLTDSKENDPGGPLYHEIPYSEHEEPKEVYIRSNYTTPWKWTKPALENNNSLEFIPKKLYAQVRASHIIKRVPQEEAIETAVTEDDKENAARLREVITNSKVATVYTEEGYEDAAYDHGGNTKNADFVEDFSRNLRNERDYNGNYNPHLDKLADIEELVGTEEERSFEDELSNSGIDPKFITQTGITQLENQIKYSNLEAEKGSDIYRAEKLMKPEEDEDDKANLMERRMLSKTNYFQGSKNYNNTHDSSEETKQNLRFEKEIAPVYTIRPRNKPVTQMKKSSTNLKTSKKKKKINIPSENNLNFSATEKYEKTTIRSAETGKIFTLKYTSITDAPIIKNYDNMFWKYFKGRQNQQVALQPETEETTFYPNTITRNSVNRHGQYMIYKNRNFANNSTSESTTLRNPHPLVKNAGSDESLHKIINTTFYPDMTDSTIGNTDYKYEINSNTFMPLRHDEDLIYNSTPTSNTISPQVSNDISSQKMTHFEHNPFLINFARSAKNKIPRYTVLIRPPADRSNENAKSNPFVITRFEQSQPKRLQHSKQFPQILTIKKHEKIMDHLRNQRKLGTFKGKLNIRLTQNPIFLTPPLSPRFKEITYTDFLPHSSISAMDHSSMTSKSRRLKESEHRQSANFLDNPFVANHSELQKNSDSTSSKRFSLIPFTTTRNTFLDIWYLRPPTPFSKSKYAQYGIRRKRSEKELIAKSNKKFVVAPFRNPSIVKYIYISKNDFQDSRQRSISTKPRNKRKITPKRKSTEHIVESDINLFNESSKITDEIINEEIKKRFGNEKKENNSMNNEHENIEIEIPEFEYDDIVDDSNILNISTTSKLVTDVEKYPFYNNNSFSNFSVLKYIVNPKRVPKKTLGGMEFYNSRNSLRCDEVKPNLENVVPTVEEPVVNRGLKEDLPRLRGLGDKLDCFKTKYFDDNPLDNPLFLESYVEQPMLTKTVLNTTKIDLQISNLPSGKHEYISLQVFKKPELEKFRTQINRPILRSQKSRGPTSIRKTPNLDKITGIKNKTSSKKKSISVPIKNKFHRIYNQRSLKVPKQRTTNKESINSQDSHAMTPYLKL